MKLSWQINRIRSALLRPRVQVQDKPVILREGEVCEAPVFIVGVHRSGTSLMRRILNSHRNIACPPETFFLAHYAAMARDPDTMAGFAGFGYSREEALAEIARQAATMHEAFRLASGKPRWADKTPQYTAILPDLLALFGTGTRFVMALRHPYDILYSIAARGLQFAEPGDDPFRANALYVRDAIARMTAFMDANPGLCMSYRYETLVADPEATLRTICAFLDEPFDPAMLDYHRQPHNYGTEDPVVLGTSGFIRSQNNWSDFTVQQRETAKDALSDTVAALGYAT